MDKLTRKELKALKRNTPRLKPAEKKTWLEFLDGDEDTQKIGINLIEHYLSIHTNEKHFKRKYLTKKKMITNTRWSMVDTHFLRTGSLKLHNPSFITYTNGINE